MNCDRCGLYPVRVFCCSYFFSMYFRIIVLLISNNRSSTISICNVYATAFVKSMSGVSHWSWQVWWRSYEVFWKVKKQIARSLLYKTSPIRIFCTKISINNGSNVFPEGLVEICCCYSMIWKYICRFK